MHNGLTKLFLEACTNVAWRHMEEVLCVQPHRDYPSETDDEKLYSLLALARAPYTEIMVEFCSITRQAYSDFGDDPDPEKRFGVLDILDFIEDDLLWKVRFENYWQEVFAECMRSGTYQGCS